MAKSNKAKKWMPELGSYVRFMRQEGGFGTGRVTAILTVNAIFRVKLDNGNDLTVFRTEMTGPALPCAFSGVKSTVPGFTFTDEPCYED